MVYRIFLHGTKQKIAEYTSKNPIWEVGEEVPIVIDGKETPCSITGLGSRVLDGDVLKMDVWVKPHKPDAIASN